MADFSLAMQELINSGDWESLGQMLRNPRKSVDLRMQAARALAQTQIPEGGEALLEAIFEDPSQQVRDAAFEALKLLVGPETSRLALETYGEEPAPLGTSMEEPVEKEEAQEIEWGIDDVVGLTNIATGDSNPANRIRAIQALGKISHFEAVNYLAYVALWEDDEAVRKAAYEMLAERYGDDLDSFLAEQRSVQLAEEGMTEEDLVDMPDEEDEEEDEDEDGDGEAKPTVYKATYAPLASPDPVNQEVNSTRGFLIALAGVAVIAMIVYLLFFG